MFQAVSINPSLHPFETGLGQVNVKSWYSKHHALFEILQTITRGKHTEHCLLPLVWKDSVA